jgi:hypothetical protein
LRRQADADLTAVHGRPNAHQQPALLEPISQADNTVGAKHQVLGKLAHGRPVCFTRGPNRQEHLVLLRLEADGTRRLLAEMEESANVAAKIAEGPVLVISHL